MANLNTLTNKIERGLFTLARGVSHFSYPTSWEKLEIDENRSVWASYTPDYLPGPALQGETPADLAIIGGGFTGISTAYHFSQRYPEKRVVLLEAKSLANGASGRNGGQMLNWVYGTGPMTDEVTARLYGATRQTMDGIEAIIQKHNLDVSYRRDGSIGVLTDPQRAEEAEKEAEYYQQLGLPIRFLNREALRQYIGVEGVYGALFDPTEGQLNGVQFIRGLRPVLQERGVDIYENTPVLSVEEGSTITLTTPNGTVKAKAIVLALNGYTGKLGYFRKSYFPLHSHVFATEPRSNQQFDEMGWHGAACFGDDLNRISYGARTNEGHIVFGGGSNISYDYLFNSQTAFPGSPQSARPAFNDMHQTLSRYLPGTAQLPHAYQWTGTLAITLRRNCSMGVRGEHKNVYYALGYSGHGVTAANMAGRVLTDLYSGEEQAWSEMPFINSEFAPIPLEPFRWMGYQMMTRLTGKSPKEPQR